MPDQVMWRSNQWSQQVRCYSLETPDAEQTRRDISSYFERIAVRKKKKQDESDQTFLEDQLFTSSSSSSSSSLEKAHYEEPHGHFSVAFLEKEQKHSV